MSTARLTTCIVRMPPNIKRLSPRKASRKSLAAAVVAAKRRSGSREWIGRGPLQGAGEDQRRGEGFIDLGGMPAGTPELNGPGEIGWRAESVAGCDMGETDGDHHCGQARGQGVQRRPERKPHAMPVDLARETGCEQALWQGERGWAERQQA